MTILSKIPSRFGRRRGVCGLAATTALVVSLATATAAPKQAQVSQDGTKIATPIAAFSGLDKITGRIISFDVAIDETVQFGALQVTPRVCYTRPQTMAPLTTTFVEVDEITLDNKIRRIFTGWMFADSPGLHAVEHAVYDVWLTDCRMSSDDPAARAKAGIPIDQPATPGTDAAAPANPVPSAAPAVPKPVAKPQPAATAPATSAPAATAPSAAAPATPAPATTGAPAAPAPATTGAPAAPIASPPRPTTPAAAPAAPATAPAPTASAPKPAAPAAPAAPLPTRSELPPLR